MSAVPAVVWPDVCTRLRREISPVCFEQWIAQVAPAGINDERLVLIVEAGIIPRNVVAHWFAKRYAPRVAELVREVSDLAGIDFRGPGSEAPV